MEALLLLGGNVGDVADTFHRAETLIDQRIGPVLARGRDHHTEPWGFIDERLFLNRALVIRTDQAPDHAMRTALSIERELGRVRKPDPGYTARTIDIDVLLWGAGVISRPDLTVPHPRMHQRAFALAPAADVAPGWMHPLLGRSILTLLNDVLRTH